MCLQVAIVLFRTLVEFYDTPLRLTTLPLIIWRFAIIGVGSILTGMLSPLTLTVFLLERLSALRRPYQGYPLGAIQLVCCAQQKQDKLGCPERLCIIAARILLVLKYADLLSEGRLQGSPTKDADFVQLCSAIDDSS